MQLRLTAGTQRALAAYSLPILLGLLLILAFGVRLRDAAAPPMDFHATRQYRSLLIARSIYFDAGAAVPAWSKQVAAQSRERQGLLEPPIMEWLVAGLYRIGGAESVLAPRLLATLFWLIGAGLLYRIARTLTTPPAALFAAAFFLLLPFAVVASRSFQPDPLMIALLLGGVYGSLRYHAHPSPARFALAAGSAAAAAFVKPTALFVALGVFGALAVARQGPGPALRSRAVWLFGLTTLLPTLGFYLYGMVFADTLRTQAQASFLPQLLVSPFFWKGWITNIGQVTGYIPLILGLLGLLLLPAGQSRALMLGMWGGYGLFCLVFNYHIATHDYYHLQLVPIVALSLGPFFALLFDQIARRADSWFVRPALGGVLALALLLTLALLLARPTNPELDRRAAVAETIGERVGHSTSTVYLAYDYGLPLEYHGQLSGVAWPIAADLEWEALAGEPAPTAEERFAAQFAPRGPDYFIVTDFQEFAAQPDLQAFLADSFALVEQNDDYLLYDLGRPATAQP